ncbi:MAG: hypothetical protein AMXMBFR47_04420 [Planctomycetota bacterium]
MSWYKKALPRFAGVFYRGNLPPRPGELKDITRHGIRIVSKETLPDTHWAFKVEHAEWGPATIMAPRDLQPPPPEMLGYCARGFTESEMVLARAAGAGLAVRLESTRDNVLRDCKNMLRYVDVLMREDGLLATDFASELLWSRSMLEDELAHDADVDISALHVIHAVGDDERRTWLHTHGLGHVGGLDFDIVAPGDAIASASGIDPLRALAFASVEGDLKPGAVVKTLGFPVKLVDAATFQRKAPREYAALREDDEAHTPNRVVLCEPSSGFLGLGSRVQPSKRLSGDDLEGGLIWFSDGATELMERRARATYPLLRKIAADLAEFEFPTIVKLGYEVDGSSGREHLWFSVHGLDDDAIDATLENSPFNIARLKMGDRGRHPVERLSDWMIMTPAGSITPHHVSPHRLINDRRDELRKLMREARGA